MDLIMKLFDIVMHVDQYMAMLVQNYGNWVYLLLFCIVFCETGLVVTPFLPGDSLLFVAGAFAASNIMDLTTVLLIFFAAAVLGDAVNFYIGKKIGPAIYNRDSKLIKKEHLDKTRNFYEKHGGKTIILARFIPIIRTFAPFVAGIGEMEYGKFFIYNVIGGGLWVLLCIFAGYFFGNFPIVKDNFELVIYAIIGISVLPVIFEYGKSVIASKKQKA